jgi:anaerobic selenocysteine-containing dehydrogenase
LVCIDPFPNATTALAHVVFPPTLWPERWDTNLHMNNQRPASADGRAPPVDESEPAIEAPGQTRDDWEILLELTRAAGALPWSLGWLGPKTPRYIARLARSLPLIHPIRITKNLLIPKFITQLARRDTRYPAVVLLTSHRNLGAMNSWIGSPAPATAHPETMSSLPFPTLSDASLPPGVVVLPFGNETANTYTTNDDLDPFTGTPVFNGVVLPPRTPPAPDGR